jgi:putative transposase
MPRRARLRLAHIPFHVIHRGSNGTAVFRRTRDRLLYLHLLRTHAASFGVAVHAYVLMTNHVHLLMTPGDAVAISEAMKRIAQMYVQHFNRWYGRTGTLWNSRFRSSLVDSERYLMTCYRYIECNPVRAGMVADPAAYRWSSHRANAYGQPDPLISPHSALHVLGRTPDERRLAYRELFRTPLDERELRRIREAAKSGLVLGDAPFEAQITATLQKPVTARRRGRPKKTENPAANSIA